MQLNDFIGQEKQPDVAYTSPLVYVVRYRSEGIMCASYGKPNEPGKELPEGDNGWDF